MLFYTGWHLFGLVLEDWSSLGIMFCKGLKPMRIWYIYIYIYIYIYTYQSLLLENPSVIVSYFCHNVCVQVFTISLAALGSLMWLRKNKPKTMIPIIYTCALIIATMPSITSYLKRVMGWHFPKIVGFEMLTSLVMAFISCQLFILCQRPSL